MQQALTFSGGAHLIFLVLLWLGLPTFTWQEPAVLQVKLVSSLQAPPAPPEAPVKTTTPLRTQQSNAPREAPKNSPAKAPTPAHATKLAPAPTPPQQVKPYTAGPTDQGVSTEALRPEKLDKAPDKKPVLSDQNAELRELKPEDFNAALDYLKQLQQQEAVAPPTTSIDLNQPGAVDVNAVEVNRIRRHIEQNWFRPAGLQNLEQLQVIVLVELLPDGTVAQLAITQSSGQPFFDASLVRAVKKASPIPIPTDKFSTYQRLELRFSGAKS